MTAAVTATPSSGLLTISGTGLTASTVYAVIANITGAAFAWENTVTTDGSGAFTLVVPTPQSLQGATVNVNVYANDPVAESSVTTLPQTQASVSAAATTTYVIPTPRS